MIIQIPGGPASGDVGAIAQLLFSLAGFVGVLTWAVFKIMEKKDQKKNGHNGSSLKTLESTVAELRTKQSEFEGRMSERTRIHEEILDQLRIEFAARPWHKITSEVAALLGEAELRLAGRMDRIELRIENSRSREK